VNSGIAQAVDRRGAPAKIATLLLGLLVLSLVVLSLL
jgi:hypothetical protein